MSDETMEMRVVAKDYDGVRSYDFRMVVFRDGLPYTYATVAEIPAWSDYAGEQTAAGVMAEFNEAFSKPVLRAEDFTYERIRNAELAGLHGRC